MFRQFARLPLRRCLHSQAGAASTRIFARHSRSAYVLGASVTVATYLAWSLNSHGQHISLDSEGPTRCRSTLPLPLLRQTNRTPSTPSPPQNDVLEQPTAPPAKSGDPDTPPPPAAEGEREGEQGDVGGAFNPETGEINWDCPCLGGMAHGPCGQQFRDAFSCFVFSEKEPKGIDCVEKFKAMQDCFREHPDVYGAGKSAAHPRESAFVSLCVEEIMDDDDEEGPAESVNSEKPEEVSHLPETLPAETSEQQPAPASS
ncbi:hypothetical protein BU15DRAFT_41601 [Melanogaster broomeanus]|nr:hypothetical protein BU15DRAFT_41601 [Melanogaster broomeanus]